jgi:hypothetical protein
MDRRRVERRAPGVTEPLSRVRLRTGRELTVIDVSNHGSLLEGTRLLPGTHVDVHVTTQAGRVLVRCRIVRAYVAAVTASEVCYRSALAFDRPVDTSNAGYPLPTLVTVNPSPAGTAYPSRSDPIEAALEQTTAV